MHFDNYDFVTTKIALIVNCLCINTNPNATKVEIIIANLCLFIVVSDNTNRTDLYPINISFICIRLTLNNKVLFN